MAGVSPLAELLGQAIYQFTVIKPLLPTYGHLLLSALFPIVIGAHASLARPNTAAKPPKKSGSGLADESEDENEEDEDQDEDQKMEGLAPSDALIFPLTAGLTLSGLYLVIKWMGADTLNKILGFYFSQMGIFFAMAFVKDCLSVWRSFIFPRKYSSGGNIWKQKPSNRTFIITQDCSSQEPAEVRKSPLPGSLALIPLPSFVVATLWACRSALYWRAKLRVHIHRAFHAECSVGTLDLLSGLLSLPTVAYFTFISKPWWLTNFLGFSFCYGTLQFMSPSTFLTGSLILTSLFFYDIYFVYFTPLMVTVAKKLDVPIKLLFPRPSAPGEAPDTISLAMLGLGDIIIPGMMVGLALRFDLYLYYKWKGVQKAKVQGEASEFVKPVYQTATGGWGERFWTQSPSLGRLELDPPYHDARSFPKTYFKASIVGYTLGMIATLVVMQIFDHPQPALLYLVPGVLIALWGTAFFKNQINDMWEFTDSEEEAEESSEEDHKENDEQAHSSDQKPGFFSRIFFRPNETTPTQNAQKGTDNGSTSPENRSNESGDVKKNEKPPKKGSELDDKDKPISDHLDLVSISLYVPRKTKPQKPQTQTDNKDTSSDGESWSYVGAADKGNEPPAKRRRRSPRTTAAISD
ncbi:hypothetical protein AOCH_004336 [Aspergillus ochraceoroseus]|uniref:Signal peptide peptidase n=1 Tax=Aspergillus ochraceoroseus TaxID=138278 RepID=A0A0F8USF6_9EURO|nr:hypothetical protein AOCH_004336 [Aspergillus ochraceoroseus]